MNKVTQNSSLLSVILTLASGNIVASILNLVSGLLVARMVLPEIMGTYNSITLFISYAVVLQFGVLNGLNRELPFNVGRGKLDRVIYLTSTSQFWAFLVSSLSSLIFLIVSLNYFIEGNIYYAFGWFSCAISVFVSIFAGQFIKSTFRSNNDFKKLAYSDVIKSIISLLTVSLVYYFNFYGMCLRMIVVAIIELAFLYYWRPYRVKSGFYLHHFKRLLLTGFPNFIVGYLDIFWGTLGSLLIVKLAGVESLGLFSLSLLTLTTCEIITNSINQIIYPKMAQKLGEGQTIMEMLLFSFKPGLFTFFAMLLVSGICWFALPYFVEFLIPNYLPGVEAARLILLAALVNCFSTINHIFIVIKKQQYYILAKSIGIIINIFIAYLLFQNSGSLSSFSISLFVGRFVFLLICYYLAFFVLANKNSLFYNNE